MSAFHRWLLKHRPKCEIGSCMIDSTRIGQVKGHNKAMCDAHYRAYHPIQALYEANQYKRTTNPK